MDTSIPFQALLEHLTKERESLIIAQLVGKHYSGTITAQDALAGIAAIAALRGLVRDADTRLKSPK